MRDSVQIIIVQTTARNKGFALKEPAIVTRIIQERAVNILENRKLVTICLKKTDLSNYVVNNYMRIQAM